MSNTPAEVLRASLVAGGIGVLYSKHPSTAWPIFVGHLPSSPDNAICVYNTSGMLEGRIQGTGETISKPGFQVMVRGTDYHTASTKMQTIISYLDTILRERVGVNGDVYVIQAVRQVGTMLDIGQEPDGKQRNELTLNGTITYAAAA